MLTGEDRAWKNDTRLYRKLEVLLALQWLLLDVRLENCVGEPRRPERTEY